MRILLIIKRFSSTIGKDAILNDFGREIRLAEELQKKHQVTVLAGDHVKKENKSTKLHGVQVEIRPFSILKLNRFLKEARKLAAENDVVIGTTHPLFAFAAHLAAGNKGFVYDLRDNYEAYDFSNFPMLRKGLLGKLMIRALNNFLIKKCSLAVCVSDSLMRKVQQIRKGRTIVVQNGVEKIFRPLDRNKSRKKLGLPDAPIITYIGHVSEERGTKLLLKAFGMVREKQKNAVLLLSGRVDKEINIKKPGIVYMELPIRKDVVLAINAADVAVLPQPANETSKYTFPYKLMEYMACNTPVVATAIGDVKEVLREYQESLCEDNAEDMAEKILTIIEKKKKVNYSSSIANYTWEKLAMKLNSELVKLG